MIKSGHPLYPILNLIGLVLGFGFLFAVAAILTPIFFIWALVEVVRTGDWQAVNTVTKSEGEYLAKALKPVRVLGGVISID